MGELCRKDTDCCNNETANGPGICQIFNQASGVGRCGNPGGCAPTGEVCKTADGAISGSRQCCPMSAPAGDPMYCVATQPTGTYRCSECFNMGGTCDDNADCCSGTCNLGNGTCTCTPDGAECQTAGECCNGVCTPDANGVRHCAPGCVMDGNTCTANSDCCGGYCDTQTLLCTTILL
jgi:hypothetical protein